MIHSGWQAALLGALVLGGPSGLGAADSGFFQTQNQGALVVIFGLPAPGEAWVLGRGEGSFRMSLDLANQFSVDKRADESIELDGESARTTLAARLGFGSGLELGAELPILSLGGGCLDHFIETYHSTFGFPSHGRELVAQNRTVFLYQKGGSTLLDMEQSGTGLGDLRLSGALQLRPNLALRASLKLPTGDSEHLRGSGSTDLALWGVGSTGSGPFTLSGSAGVLAMSKGRVLADQQRSLVGFGSAAISYAATPRIVLRAQANAHSAFYSDSSLRELSGASVQLTLGGELRLSRGSALDLGLTEDVAIDRSPDVVFHVAYRRTLP